MQIYQKALSMILVFFLCSPCITAKTHTKNYEETEIWKNMISGKFVPISTLTLRQYVLNPKIWIDDNSIYRFVSVDVPFSDKKYKPQNLITLSGSNISQAGRNSFIREDAKTSLLEMANEFHKYFHEPLVAISAFRGVEYQQRLWDLGRCGGGAFCAKP